MGIDSDDEYTMSMCDLYNVDITGDGEGFEFDLEFVVSDEALNKAPNQFGDNGSVKTFRDDVIKEAPNPKMLENERYPHSRASTDSNKHSPIPDDTQAYEDDGDSPNRASRSPEATAEEVQKTLEALKLSHPDIFRTFTDKLQQNPNPSKHQLRDNQKSTAVSPNEGVDGS
jgi:hypothetical protein